MPVIRANLSSVHADPFDEYGDRHDVYRLSANGQSLTLHTKGKRLPSGYSFERGRELLFDIDEQNEVVGFHDVVQRVSWGRQNRLKHLLGARERQAKYSYVSGTVTGKSSEERSYNSHIKGSTNSTIQRYTVYTINISGRSVLGSSDYAKIKAGDKVRGVLNDQGYLAMLENTATGKVYGLSNSIWWTLLVIGIAVAINALFLMDPTYDEPVEILFGEIRQYHENMFFFNLAAIPIAGIFVYGTMQRMKVMSFYRQSVIRSARS